MSHLEVHHNLALRLLVGRSIPEGIPWTLDEDQQLVEQEKALWNCLSPEDQQWEQEFLAELWRSKGSDRELPVNPDWGEWTVGVPAMVTVVDDAFGSPLRAYRPDPRGKMLDGDPWCDWLWSMGFRLSVVEEGSPRKLLLAVPAHRVLQEADRLVVLIHKHHPEITLHPWGDPIGGLQIKSGYDPVQKRTEIEMRFS